MTKFSVAMIATFAIGCGGGGKKVDTAKTEPTVPDTTAATDTATPAVTDVKPVEAPQPPRKVLKSLKPDQLEWKPLVAEAGDKGPMVAALWGDMMNEANGFFIKVPAGEKGMLHTHTNDYHGIAVTASTAGQDGGKTHVVAQGSYWFQPGGTAHINACPGKTPCIGFAHFTAGKFDFAPAKATKGAKPDPKAIEKTIKAAKWIPFDEKNPKGGAWSALWGDMKADANGMFVKLPAGNPEFWHIHSSDYHGVVLAGTLDHHESGTEPNELPTGSYWWQPGGNKHVDLRKAGGPDCVVYVYFENAFDAKPAE
jgi:quercetin dioxygenase-like cupin family protein